MDNVKIQSENGNEAFTINSVTDNANSVKSFGTPLENDNTGTITDDSDTKNWKQNPSSLPLLDNAVSNTTRSPLNNNPLPTPTPNERKDPSPRGKGSPRNSAEGPRDGSEKEAYILKNAKAIADPVELESKCQGVSSPFSDKSAKNGIKDSESHAVVSATGKNGSLEKSDLSVSDTPAASVSDSPAHSHGGVSEGDSKRPATPYMKQIDERKHKPVIDVEREFSLSASLTSQNFVIKEEASGVSPKEPGDMPHTTEEPTKKTSETSKMTDQLSDETPLPPETSASSKFSEETAKKQVSSPKKKEESLLNTDLTSKTDSPKVSLPTDKKEDITGLKEKDWPSQTDKSAEKPEDDKPKSSDPSFSQMEGLEEETDENIKRSDETLKKVSENLDGKLPEQPKESPKSSAPPKREVTEEKVDNFDGREPVVEEVVMKREIKATGTDDKLIDEWRKSEEETRETKEKGEKQREGRRDAPTPSFENEITPSKQPGKTSAADNVMDDIVSTFGDFGLVDAKKSPRKEEEEEDVQEGKGTRQDEKEIRKETEQEIKEVKEEAKETKREMKETQEEVKGTDQRQNEAEIETEEALKHVRESEQEKRQIKPEAVEVKSEKEETNQAKPKAKKTKRVVDETKREAKNKTEEVKEPKRQQEKEKQSEAIKSNEEGKLDPKVKAQHNVKDTTTDKSKNKTGDKQSADQKQSRKSDKAKMKQEKELKEKHKQIVKAVRKLLPEEGHDSGVDENTQSKDGAAKAPPKDGRASPRKRQPRSVDPSPMKRTPQSTGSVERKPLPMNKIEVGKSASPNIKNVRSKIGSLDNTTYKPGGGNIKIESKKLDFSRASSKIEAKNNKYAPGGGEKKIEVVKLKWNASSKVGSLEKKDHKPGGGDKKVETHKLNFKDKAQSKVGSKDNIKHKAGGGDVEIPTEKLEFTAKAASKVGSLDNVKHKPKGGDKKIFDDKEYLRQMQTSSSASPCKTPTSKTSSGRASGAISPATTGTISPGPQEE